MKRGRAINNLNCRAARRNRMWRRLPVGNANRAAPDFEERFHQSIRAVATAAAAPAKKPAAVAKRSIQDSREKSRSMQGGS